MLIECLVVKIYELSLILLLINDNKYVSFFFVFVQFLWVLLAFGDKIVPI